MAEAHSAVLTTASRERRFTSTSLNISGTVLVVAGAGMLFSALVDAADGGPDVTALAAPGAAVAAAGFLLRRVTRVPKILTIRVVFSAVASAWIALAIAAAVPYLTTGALDSPADALFEAVSGVTTTGASVIAPVEAQSAGLLFWRASTQWFGGLGVVVLAVAVLPYLGAGGMSLLRSELPGHGSDRLAPRVRDTARRLSGVYVGFTAAMTLGFALAGLSAFDATAHAFATVSTGGFSTRDGSIGAFDSAPLEWLTILGMYLAGMSFVLLYRASRGRFGPLLRSAEARAYTLLLLTGVALVGGWNVFGGTLDHDTVRHSVFAVVSMGSTTGFWTGDWGAWIQPAQAVLLFLTLVGGTTGSTAGGSKVLRLLAALSYARREILQHVHPRLVRVIRVGDEVVPEEVVSRILGYHALFFVVIVAGSVAVASFDVDILSSLSVAASSVSNVGPGLGAIGPTGGFLDIDPWARGVAMLLMLLGRLEIYPVLLGLADAIDRSIGILPPRLARAITRRLP